MSRDMLSDSGNGRIPTIRLSPLVRAHLGAILKVCFQLRDNLINRFLRRFFGYGFRTFYVVSSDAHNGDPHSASGTFCFGRSFESCDILAGLYIDDLGDKPDLRLYLSFCQY
jgi:hypothetical protein